MKPIADYIQMLNGDLTVSSAGTITLTSNDPTKPIQTVFPDGDIKWTLNGVLHRDDGPAHISSTFKIWYKNGKRHRLDGPAWQGSNDGGGESWWKEGKRHREDGPANIYSNGVKQWWLDGKEFTEEEFNKKMNIDTKKSVRTVDPDGTIRWKLPNGIHHREDGPAYEEVNGYKQWLINGKLHREDGPAVDGGSSGRITSWWLNGKNYSAEDYAAEMKLRPEMRIDSYGHKRWTLNGKAHRLDGPAIEFSNGDKHWFKDGKNHRDDGPAVENVDGTKVWWVNGKAHRLDGPAVINPDGTEEYWVDHMRLASKKEFDKIVDALKKKENHVMTDSNVSTMTTDIYGTKIWKLPNGKYHREDGPAIERINGGKEWYQNGSLHRVDGPAIEFPNGDKEWRFNGKPHREDGPTFEGANGARAWWVNGKRHRTEGPARIQIGPNGKVTNEWYIDGIQLTEEEFNKKMSNTPIKTSIGGIESWKLDGKLHREDGPAWTDSNGDKHWFFNDLHHRLDGPAFEGANGAKSWWVKGKRHREDGPARIDSHGVKEWYLDGVKYSEGAFTAEMNVRKNLKPKLKNGLHIGIDGTSYWYKDDKLHRDDGPAIITKEGRYWYKDGKQHREGAPAVERLSGEKIWIVNGRHHRLDGPAVEDTKGYRQWWIDGQNMLEEQFKILTNKSNEKKEGIKVANEVTFMDRVKADATEAGYRVAATQFTAAVKGAILLLFKDKGFDESKLSVLKEMMESEFGTAMVSAVLGYGLVYVPKLKEDPRVLKLAKEFRVNGMAVAGNEIMGIGMQYMMPALSKAMESLPPIQEVMPPVLRKKTGKKRVHTETPQIPQGESTTEEKTSAV